MKKLIFIAAVLASAFFAASCQQEMLDPQAEGTTVTYTVEVPNAIATKAIGDEITAVDKVYYEVYRAAEVEDLSKTPVYQGEEPVINNSASFDLEFVNNQEFVVLFWAQNSALVNTDVTSDAGIYNINDLRQIQLVNPGAANNDAAQVFAGSDRVSNCASAANGNVTLTRPVSQINVYTTKESLKLRGVIIDLETSSMTVAGLYNTYNVATGDAVVTPTTATFAYTAAAVPTVPADNANLRYVAMNYVGFASQVGTNVTVDFTIQTSEAQPIVHSVSNVPLKPNYRTNISGNLITATTDYNVSLNDDWGTPSFEVEVVNSVAELASIFEELNDVNSTVTKAEVALGADMDLSELFNLGASTFATKAGETAPLPIVIPEGKTVVLNLNGYNVTVPEESKGRHYYAFDNYGTLTIQSSTGKGAILSRGIYNSGALTLESGTISAIDQNGGFAVQCKTGSTFVMNGGTLTTGEDDNFGAVTEGGYDATTLGIEDDATATINGGLIDNPSDYTFAIYNVGTVVVNGGEIRSVHSTVSSYGNLTVNGGSFTCNGIEGVTAHALVAWEGSETTINGGSFNGKDNYNGFNVDADKGAVVNISGGEFLPVHSGSLYGEGTINVTGGTFFDNPSVRIVPGYEATKNEEGNYVVTKMPDLAKIGETAYYSLQMAIDAAEENQTVVLVSDVVLNSSVEIDDLTYEGTQSVAINVPAGKKLTLDLNGHNIETSSTMTGEFTGGRAHVISNLGDLTIVDNGSTKGAIISNTSDANTGGYTIFNQASLTVEGVTIVGNNGRSYALTTRGENAVTVVNNCTVYGRGGIAVEGGCNVTINGENTLCYSNETARSTSHALYIAEGNVTINAGTFKSKEVYNGFVINHGAGNLTINGGNFVGHHNGETLNNCLYLSGGSTGTAVINAGTFTHGIEKAGNSTGSVVVKGGSFGQDVTKYLADGYELTENEGRYTVRQLPAAKIGETEYETLEAAVAAAKADDTIVVLRDIELPEYKLALPENSTLVVNANVAIKTLSAVNGCTITIKEGKTMTLNNFSFGSKDTADAEYEIAGGTVVANYGFFQHGTYSLYSNFETGYMYYSYGSDITVYGTFHSQGKGDGLDYVRGKLTIAEGGRSIHDKSLWIGQPASWGAMNASLVIEEGGYVQANSLSVYEGSSLTYSNDANLKYNSVTGTEYITKK